VIRHVDASRDEGEWTLVIRPERRWLDLRLDELWRYRDLVVLFVRRDFVANYKQTMLGPVWYLLQPLITSIAFVIVFGRVAGLSTDGRPQILFYMLGTVVWSYFAGCLTQTSGTFLTNAGLFGKVYFPRLAVPIATVVSNLMMFAIQFAQFAAFAAFFAARGSPLGWTPWVLVTPLLLLVMAALGLGLGITISSLTTRYRDLQYLVAFGTQLLMFATPVIYPLSSVSPRYRWLASANPMTAVVETFRLAFLGAGTVSVASLAYSAAMSAAVLIAGALLFNHVERTFMDTV
jgi:lipopolysaccharide transport system permease protein